MSTVQLSTVKSDFLDLRSQLQSILQGYDSWKDLVVSGTGQTLIDLIAGIGAYNQYSIERAVQEVFMETAVAPSSVYSIARLLGTRISRKKPAQVTVNLTRDTYAEATSIPKYSKFVINIGATNVDFINTDIVVFVAGQQSISVVLTEGSENIHEFVSDGSNYQNFVIGSKFTSSDSLVRLVVNEIEEYTRVNTALWNYDGIAVFYENTTQLGEVDITLGNGIYGKKPAQFDNIVIYEYVLAGTSTNTNTTGLPVSCSVDSGITGLTTTVVSGAEDEKDYKFYKHISPQLYAANSRAVTRKDCEAIIKTYQGIVDARVYGEADINPSDLRWMNMIGVYAITTTNWSTDKQAEFINWFEDYKIVTTKVLYNNAQPVPIIVDVDVLVDKKYNLALVQNQVTDAINEYFKPKEGTIGTSFYLSSLIDVILSITGVRYVTYNSPSDNIKILFNQYLSLREAPTVNVSYIS
jgi:hypothetical protein